jgi:CMP-2-keto-3-deoxyoctulosonic acid synthetase
METSFWETHDNQCGLPSDTAMKKKIIAIIPARMASTRFPNKPLTKILDLPMVEHIRRRALLADDVAEIIGADGV